MTVLMDCDSIGNAASKKSSATASAVAELG